MNPSSRPWWPRLLAFLPPLGHPLVTATIVVLAVRGLGLGAHYFGRDLDGQPLVAMPMTLFPAAFAYHYLVLLATALALLLAWKTLPRLRPAALVLAFFLFAAAALLGQVDFEMLRLVGRRFTPSVLTTYGPQHAFTSEILLPLAADRAHTIFSLALIFGGWSGLAFAAWRGLRTPREPRWSWPWFAVLAALVGYLALVPARYTPSNRTLLQPPEITFAHTWLGHDRTPPPAGNARDIAALLRTRLVPASPALQWLNDAHPLVHLPAGDAVARADPPDIIVLMIESLSARRLGFVNPGARDLTPGFDALARESVVFPHFIANGYPSAPGFFAVNASALPHRTKTISADFPDRHFDALPVRLKDLGYRRLAIWGGNAALANELAWARRWYDEVDYQIAGNALEYHHSRGDAETFRVLIDHVARADREQPGRPQFVFVATAGTHGPFSSANSYFSQPEDRAAAAPYRAQPDDDRVDNYDHMLVLLDAQIARLRAFLATRARRDHTVLVICGDHSVAVADRASYDIRGFPVDGVVWTSALLNGPAALVGPPRREMFPSSQADLMPTLLALAGDNRPTVSMGADLLAPIPVAQRFAVAVRDDGYRLDRGDWTLFVSATDPADYFVHRSFQPVERSRASDSGGPFTARDARDLHAAVQAWSWLIEQDRVWPDAARP
ncbi:MAG TPA: sulfatase-like hydrolase/transferase [Opitutaceae bacterium]|nr:sulfatase-like hydrolase/transferase [Opitutaceae bacterium]